VILPARIGWRCWTANNISFSKSFFTCLPRRFSSWEISSGVNWASEKFLIRSLRAVGEGSAREVPSVGVEGSTREIPGVGVEGSARESPVRGRRGFGERDPRRGR